MCSMAYEGTLEGMAQERAGEVPFRLLGLEGATLSKHAQFVEALKRHTTLGTYHLPAFVEDCFSGNVTPDTIQQAFGLLCSTAGVDEDAMREEVAGAIRDAGRDLSPLDNAALRKIGLNIVVGGA